MTAIGLLKRSDDGFEFQYDELNLTIRSQHAEWVLEAASELIGDATRLEAECRIEELTMLVESGNADTAELDADRQAYTNRFEHPAHCVITMGALDYRWISSSAGSARQDQNRTVSKPSQPKQDAPCLDTKVE